MPIIPFIWVIQWNFDESLRFPKTAIDTIIAMV